MSMWNLRPGKREPLATAFRRRRPSEPTIEIDEVGRLIRVHDPRLFRSDRRRWCRKLVEAAASCHAVQFVRLDLNTASFEMQFAYEPSASLPASPTSAMANVFAGAMSEADASMLTDRSSETTGVSSTSPQEDWSRLKAFPGSIEPHQDPSLLTTGPKRVLYLLLGGGSFALIFVGLVIPGIPTVPFVMASSYYFARSSARLHDMLARSRTFGPIVVEWSTHHGLSRLSKAKLAGLTVVIVAVSLLLVPITPLVILVTFSLSSAGLYSLLRLPGIDDDTEHLALPLISRALPTASA